VTARRGRPRPCEISSWPGSRSAQYAANNCNRLKSTPGVRADSRAPVEQSALISSMPSRRVEVEELYASHDQVAAAVIVALMAMIALADEANPLGNDWLMRRLGGETASVSRPISAQATSQRSARTCCTVRVADPVAGPPISRCLAISASHLDRTIVHMHDSRSHSSIAIDSRIACCNSARVRGRFRRPSSRPGRARSRRTGLRHGRCSARSSS
jgi:hypothetical protein